MYEETLFQNTKDGKPFVDVLKEKGIVPGIKVDMGVQPLPGTELIPAWAGSGSCWLTTPSWCCHAHPHTL